MNRRQLLERLDAAWTAFRDAYAGLSEERLTEPGVVGDWSVKDVIAHVSAWEEEALTHLPHIIEGGRPPRYATTHGGIDGFNAQAVARARDLPLAEVLRRQEETHRRLVAFVGGLPEAQIAAERAPAAGCGFDAYGHYPIHTEAIRAWRGQGERPARAVSSEVSTFDR